MSKNGSLLKSVMLGIMMFLQYMMLPVWFVPMMPYVQSLPNGGDWTLCCSLIMGFGTLASPLAGMFADRVLNAERVLSVCNLMSAILLACAYFTDSPGLLFVLMLGTMCFYMPTWSLTATIAIANLSGRSFARIRVFGTLGWLAAGLFSLVGSRCFGIPDFDSTPWIFASGAAVALVAGVFALFLPPIPPSVPRGTPVSALDALGLRALVLLRTREFLVFALILLFAMVPFQWYNAYCPVYLHDSGFRYLTLTQSLGQAAEIAFMLLVPLIIVRFGYRGGLVVAFAALAFRNGCFLLSTVFGLSFLDFGGIAVHGLIFGLFVVGGQMFVGERAPRELRNQSQGLVNIIAAGLGVFLSNAVFGAILAPGDEPGRNWPCAYSVALALALAGIVLVLLLFRRRDPGRGC